MNTVQRNDSFDLLVIGGGINGAGVARDAALRGYSVLLVEQHDFASGSSSRTSKLVHGGLRYLEHGDLRLVWEACHERRVLLHTATHLVRPLSFVMPVFGDSRIGRLRLQLGMWLYDLLAAFRNVQRHRMLHRDFLRRSLPELQSSGLRGAARYWDAAMDDARLTLENILSARQSGAQVLNRTRVERLLVGTQGARGADIHDLETDTRRSVAARFVIVCTGAWTGAVLADLVPSGEVVAPTRGTHVVTRRFTDQAWTLTARDGRVFFVLPWLGLNLVGTTDVPDDRAPEDVEPSDEEIDSLIAETNRRFPQAALQRSDVISAFAGLRPLAHSTRAASSRSREHSILQPVPHLLSLVGGKYTTYRAVAEELVDRMERDLGRRTACVTAHEPLPGARLGWCAADQWQRQAGFRTAVLDLQRAGIPAASAEHWWATYGAWTPHLVQLCREEPGLAAALCTDLPHTEAEVVHAIRFEMARRLEDWYLRRSQVGLQPCHGLDSLVRVSGLFARECGWSEDRRQQELAHTRQLLQRIALSDPHATRRSA